MICFKYSDNKANSEKEASYNSTKATLDEGTEMTIDASTNNDFGDLEEQDNVHTQSAVNLITMKLAMESHKKSNEHVFTSLLDDKNPSICDMGLSHHFDNLDEVKPEDFKDDVPIVRQASEFSQRDRLRLFLTSIQWDMEDDLQKEPEDQDSGVALQRSRSSYAPDMNDDEFWKLCNNGDDDDHDIDHNDRDNDNNNDRGNDDDDKKNGDRDKDSDEENNMFTATYHGNNAQICSGEPKWMSHDALMLRLCLSHHCPCNRLTNGHLLKFFDKLDHQNKRIKLNITFVGQSAPKTILNEKVQASVQAMNPIENEDGFSIPLLPKRFWTQEMVTASLLSTNPTVLNAANKCGAEEMVKLPSSKHAKLEPMADQNVNCKNISDISKKVASPIGNSESKESSIVKLGKHPRDYECETINIGTIAPIANSSTLHTKKKIRLEHEQSRHTQVSLSVSSRLRTRRT